MSNYLKIKTWLKLIIITGGAQILIQAMGLVSGILIVRLLPTKEYAFYTLANSMLGTMALLSDGGISTAVMSLGGSVWKDKEKLGIVLSTALRLRSKFASVSLLITIPILLFLLHHNGATLLMSFLISLSLIPAFYAMLSDSLLEIVPKLHQDIKSLQSNQLKVSISRFILIGLSVFFFPFTHIAIWASGIPRIIGNIRLKKIANRYTYPSSEINLTVQADIVKIVKRVLPGAVYYCISGQLTVWLISLFGSASSIAEIGALGRISMLLGVISILVSTLIIPRFARLPRIKSLLLKRYLQIIFLIAFFLGLISALVIAFPVQLLWVLGKNYSNLQTELILMIFGSCINLMMNFVFSLYSSRGWIIRPLYTITLSIIPIIIGCYVFNLSTVQGVLILNLFIAIFEFLIHFSFGLHKIYFFDEI